MMTRNWKILGEKGSRYGTIINLVLPTSDRTRH